MKVVYDPTFFKKLKKVDVRIRKHVEERILLFSKDPNNPQLNNHALRKKYQGYRNINITSDWRAIYREAQIGEDVVAYFVALGIHNELYE